MIYGCEVLSEFSKSISVDEYYLIFDKNGKCGRIHFVACERT